MKKTGMYLLIMGFFISCSKEQTHNESTIYEKEFYSVLNDLIRIKLINTSVIQAETTPVSKAMWQEIRNPLKINLLSDSTLLATKGMYALRAENLMDSAEIRFIYNSIDSTKTIRLDSAKVVVPTISVRKLNKVFNEINREEGYEVLRETYGTSCIIKVSTPLFNSTFTKVILWIDYQCGWKHGQGYIFILEKRKGKWWLIEEVGTWIS
ncbi:hypothetical protein [Salmonirosea aquatica]|uniref:Uncharacterized protein n=1 Tax=Salmonirosea aquatica TaxID=2654236 RepID=A0A7C9FNE6_9BACT|nr:hypothetical protein [Cytophagaceae bacterium SJW1-29]